MARLEKKYHEFGPVIDAKCCVLILGSFPSTLSLSNNFFYGNPQNRFWEMMGSILGNKELPQYSNEEKKSHLLSRRIALYDVIESCEIEGSSDATIRNIKYADIDSLLKHAPIKAIYLNGSKAYSLFEKAFPQYLGIAHKMPSTSPANAKWRLPDLVASWRSILADVGEVQEKMIPFGPYSTYVRIVNPKGRHTPIFICHGGPGSTHNSYELWDEFAFAWDRPIVMYDQIGCGRSSIPDDTPEVYCAKTWLDELENVRTQLDLKEINLIGHSWGGMLSIMYICDRAPKGVLSLTLSSTLSSAALWGQETHRLLKKMSPEDQKTILENEAKGNFQDPDFKQAEDRYMKMTVSNLNKEDPYLPDCLVRKKHTGNVAYVTAWGPSEFAPLGNLHDYDYTEKMNRITVPTQLFYGSEDESTALQNELMYEHLGGLKQIHEFQGSRHMTYFEKKDEYFSILSDFLSKFGK